MLKKRIIACLDVRDGQVVKGVRFREHKVLGPVEDYVNFYKDEGVDELVFYDIGASPDGMAPSYSWLRRLTPLLDIPFCVAGGIQSVSMAGAVLAAGADKVSVNTHALCNPSLIDDLVSTFGSQCVVVGMDSLWDKDDWFIWQNAGRAETMTANGRKTRDWIEEVQARGAGEIVLNCMGRDGMGDGFDCRQLSELGRNVRIPFIASGGAGVHEHFYEVFKIPVVSGALAAGAFHRRQISIPQLKTYLMSRGNAMRMSHELQNTEFL